MPEIEAEKRSASVILRVLNLKNGVCGGKRLEAKGPTMTFLAPLRHDRIDAPWVIDGPIGNSVTIFAVHHDIPHPCSLLSSTFQIPFGRANAIVIPKIELRDVAVQMALAAMLISTPLIGHDVRGRH
jgi:hypothetical protein